LNTCVEIMGGCTAVHSGFGVNSDSVDSDSFDFDSDSVDSDSVDSVDSRVDSQG
jgi:hypothetical protein